MEKYSIHGMRHLQRASRSPPKDRVGGTVQAQESQQAHLGVPGESRGSLTSRCYAATHKALGKSPLNSVLNFSICARGIILGSCPALGRWKTGIGGQHREVQPASTLT